MADDNGKKNLTRFGVCFIINDNPVWLSPGDLIQIGDINEDSRAFLEMDEFGYFIFSVGYERDFDDFF